MNWQAVQDEQEVLACLLWAPHLQAWELDGLTLGLFSDPMCRQIARSLIAIRDSGMRVHWRRVRTDLRRRGWDGASDLVEPLVRAIGTRVGLTAAISRLHARSARRAA